jgi:hypothetical protein
MEDTPKYGNAVLNRAKAYLGRLYTLELDQEDIDRHSNDDPSILSHVGNLGLKIVHRYDKIAANISRALFINAVRKDDEAIYIEDFMTPRIAASHIVDAQLGKE